MIRSGEAMENALRACCKGIKIGKILVKRRDKDGLGSELLRRESPPVEEEENVDDIDSDEDELDLSKLPDVLYQKLPSDISERYVLLLDPLLATGYSAMAAINTLKAEGVLEERILFVSVIASTQGVHQLCTKFPRMKIITSEVDAGLSDDNRVLPGVGEFGDRYFGTEKDDDEFIVGSPSKY
jgi:uridine kinase